MFKKSEWDECKYKTSFKKYLLLLLKKAWMKKDIRIDGRQIYVDHDYPAEIIQKIPIMCECLYFMVSIQQ